MWIQIVARRFELAASGAHPAVVYVSTQQAGLVLVTIGVRHRVPVAKLMRTPAFRQWFDIAEVEDFPMAFAGEAMEKLDLERSPTVPPGIAVTAFAGVVSVREVGVRARRDGPLPSCRGPEVVDLPRLRRLSRDADCARVRR